MDPRFFLPCFYGPRALRPGHKRKETTRSITCPTDLALRLISKVLKCDVTIDVHLDENGYRETGDEFIWPSTNNIVGEKNNRKHSQLYYINIL